MSVAEQVLSAAQRPGQIELEVHTSNLLAVVKNGIEESLYQLQAFIEPSVDFCNRPQFREEFCIGYVRIGVVMHFIGHLLDKAAVSISRVSGNLSLALPTGKATILDVFEVSVVHLLRQTPLVELLFSSNPLLNSVWYGVVVYM